VFRQGNEFGIGATVVQASENARQVGVYGLAQGLGALAQKGRFAREDLAQDGAQAEHVRTLIDTLDLAARLFGGHVARRAAGRLAHHRIVHPDQGAGLRSLTLPARQHQRQAPVQHDHFAERPENNVGRLQVAVDDAAAVGVGKRLAHLQERPEQVLQRRRRGLPMVAGDGLGEGASLDETHGVERPCADWSIS
jgi:hypothetical protein